MTRPEKDVVRPGQKARDTAAILPIAGVLLLVSPLLGLFTGGSGAFGLPAPFLYVFGVWAGLILLGVWLSRRLASSDNP
ncbi:MAG: hypothetical protein AAF393_18915 [Pseudomonadota bacterium]